MIKEAKCTLDAKTYSTLTNGFLRKGSLEEALKLVYLNLSRGSSSGRFFRVWAA